MFEAFILFLTTTHTYLTLAASFSNRRIRPLCLLHGGASKVSSSNGKTRKTLIAKKCILHRKICAAFWKANSTKSSYLKNFRKYATKKCFKASNLMIIITQLQFLFNLVHNITSYDWSNLKNLFLF